MTNPSDPELVERARARDPRAWAVLVDRYGRLVAWAIRRELKRFGMGEGDTEDIFQVVWTRLWSGGFLALAVGTPRE